MVLTLSALSRTCTHVVIMWAIKLGSTQLPFCLNRWRCEGSFPHHSAVTLLKIEITTQETPQLNQMPHLNGLSLFHALMQVGVGGKCNIMIYCLNTLNTTLGIELIENIKSICKVNK